MAYPFTTTAKLSNGGTLRVTFGQVTYLNTGRDGKDGKDGQDGKNGVTFYPDITGEECTLRWTNDGGLDNPTPVNLKGADGKNGKDGKDGRDGKDGTAADIPTLSNLEIEEILS